MRRNVLIIFILCLFAVFPSCKRAPLTIGPIVTQTRELDDFSELYLNDNINLSLVRSDTCYIEITTGANIIDNITTEVKDDILTISNITTLNWARPYNYTLNATLHYKDILFLNYTASGTLVSENDYNGVLEDGEYYVIIVDGGSGDIDLKFSNCKYTTKMASANSRFVATTTRRCRSTKRAMVFSTRETMKPRKSASTACRRTATVS